MTAIVRIDRLSKLFGGVRAVDDCGFEIAKGSVTGLIGPNGAGKTTLFGLLTGFLKPDNGHVIFKGEDITGLQPYAIFRRGMCRTFQFSREFRSLSVVENLMVVPRDQMGETLWSPWLRPRRVRAQERRIRERASELLAETGLTDQIDKPASTLSVGQKKLLDLARAVMADPDLLMLDEPGAGVNPMLRRQIARQVRRLATSRGMTVLLIEHDMDLVMSICDTVVVMSQGHVIAEGPPETIRSNQAVLDAYLGLAAG